MHEKAVSDYAAEVLPGLELKHVYLVPYTHKPSSCTYGTYIYRQMFTTHNEPIEANSPDDAYTKAADMKCSDVNKKGGCNSPLIKGVPIFMLVKKKGHLVQKRI